MPIRTFLSFSLEVYGRWSWQKRGEKPVGTLLGVAAALTGAAAATAVLAGRRATAKSAVQSVREDW